MVEAKSTLGSLNAIIVVMAIRTFKFIIFALLLSYLSACSEERSIYQNLSSDQDGVIAIAIPDDDDEVAQAPEVEIFKDALTLEELNLIEKWHEGEVNNLSFVVIDVESEKIIKSYYADRPQRLASISKIPVALAALENVRNVEVPKVQSMLKISNNGEASRYVRLAAKALNGTVISTPHYSQPHSCPGEFLNDQAAANVVFDWMTLQLPNVDWAGASINDGAGCHYDNFMNSLQVTKILQYADTMGEVYDDQSFEDLLSINGVDGTWKNKNIEHKGYIFAKTGTLNPNANLSGYFYAKREGQFVKHYFSVFVNKKGGGQYSTKARNLIEGLMRYWINYYSSNIGQPIEDF